MSQDQEQAVRTRGYQLWQESGASHGHDREDWSRAEHEIAAAEDATQAASAEPVANLPQSGTGALFYAPMDLFFTMAQSWAESGRILASMTPWAAWSPRAR